MRKLCSWLIPVSLALLLLCSGHSNLFAQEDSDGIDQTYPILDRLTLPHIWGSLQIKNGVTTQILDDSARVTYHRRTWQPSYFTFDGIAGAAEHPDGPFDQMIRDCRIGDVFYALTLGAEVYRIEIVQEVQSVTTLEIRPLTVKGGTSRNKAWARCSLAGEHDGAAISTSGSMFGGFVGGFLLGLIGTGIAYAVQSTPEPPAAVLMGFDDNDCRYAYTDSYRRKGRSKKQEAALSGGLIGTAVVVTLILINSSGS